MTEATRKQITLEAVLVIILVIANLEMNHTQFFDSLDSFDAMQYFPVLSHLILPSGASNPLIILGKKFTPLRLMIRSLSVLLMLAYLLCDHFLERKRAHLPKLLMIGGLIMLLLGLPTYLTIGARLRGGHQELAHDGGTIQVEEAVKMVLGGRNPYKENYLGTPLENWRGFRNNAVYHYPYPPFSFLPSIPAYLGAQAVFGWFDQRLIYILYYCGSLILLAKMFRQRENQRIAILWLGLNPLLNHLFVLGCNDMAPIFWLLATLYAFRRQRYYTTAVMAGLAVSTKQFAVFLLPFLVLELFRNHRRDLRLQVRVWLLFLLVAGAINLPFFLHSPHDYIEDLILYSSGGLPTSYPIQGFHGYGFGSFLLFFHLIPNGNVYYPFWIWQLIFTLPVMALLARRQWRAGGESQLLSGFYLSLFVFMFFSRYLHGNFLGFIVTWPGLALLVTRDDPEGS